MKLADELGVALVGEGAVVGGEADGLDLERRAVLGAARAGGARAARRRGRRSWRSCSGPLA
ncbi:MAG: hypothetical protein MZV64_14715 [Ignavibacteriales bacterium]|nr:hypothetical protein [Ignavibacteriales bacterium]